MELASSATSPTATPVPPTAQPCVPPATPSTLLATGLALKIAQLTARPAQPVDQPPLAPLATTISTSIAMEDAASATMFLSACNAVLLVPPLASPALLDSSRTTESARPASLTALHALPTLSVPHLLHSIPQAMCFIPCRMVKLCLQLAIQDAAVALTGILPFVWYATQVTTSTTLPVLPALSEATVCSALPTLLQLALAASPEATSSTAPVRSAPATALPAVPLTHPLAPLAMSDLC